jgi:hydroxymethylglutaryl-CoA lyase
MIKIVECPRDAMQGLHDFIATDTKIAYINQLLKVGFDTLDCGSFVSPKAIPQMRDTAEVLANINWKNSPTKLLTIVANERGAQDACNTEGVYYLGYPFSVSETFQLRNTNATIAESLARVEKIQALCQAHDKKLIVYISMGFGNPYGDEWNVEIVQHWVNRLADMGIKIISLSDTVGSAKPATIEYLFKNLIPPYPDVEFGAHFHTTPQAWEEKVHAAYQNGCRRFDGAIKGYGGCPMATDDLTGNMPTENLISYCQAHDIPFGLDTDAFAQSMAMAGAVFPQPKLIFGSK